MSEVFPSLWYISALRRGAVTTGGGYVSQAGYEFANLYDWRDFSETRWNGVSGSYGEVLLGESTNIQSFILWPSIATSGGTYVLSAETGAPGGGFTTLATLTLLATDTKPRIATFAVVAIPSGNKVRITRTSAGSQHTFRLAFAGDKLVAERGMWQSVKPPTLTGTIVSDTVISVNGSLLARNVRRVDRKQMLDFSPVTQTWVRTDWEQFCQHMSKYACFYQWHPSAYPDEVVFAGAENIDQPENASPVPFMKVTMPLRCLV